MIEKNLETINPCNGCIIKGNCTTFCWDKIRHVIEGCEHKTFGEIDEEFKREGKKFEKS